MGFSSKFLKNSKTILQSSKFSDFFLQHHTIVIGYDIRKETENGIAGSTENSTKISKISDTGRDATERVETCFLACFRAKKWTGTIMGLVPE